MRFYKFLLFKILIAVIISIVIVFSVLFIFSIIELLNDKYSGLTTLLLGILNTFELLATIPTILFLMSVMIFWLSMHKSNELLIVRHYLGYSKIIMIFLIFIILFTYLELNKTKTKEIISEVKNYVISKNININLNKTFYLKNGEQFSIIQLSVDDLNINKINKISIYLLQDGFFNSALFSSENEINSDFIILKKPKLITHNDITKLENDYIIEKSRLGDALLNNRSETYLEEKKSLFQNSNSFISYLSMFLSLIVYVMIFTSRSIVNKNVNIYKYAIISLFIFIYTFLTSQTTLQNNNLIFHILVLSTFICYMYKIKSNE